MASNDIQGILSSILERLTLIEGKLSGAPAAAGNAAAPSSDVVSRQTTEFDALIAKFASTFNDLSAKLGADAAQLGAAYLKLWQFNRKIVDASSKAKKPDAATMKALQAEFAATCKPIHDVEAKRDTAFVNHAKAAKEGTMGFQWVFAENGGLALVENAKESIDFWANKVRKEAKDKGTPDHMAWANLQRDGLAALHDFVKEHFKTGLVWNAKGADAAAVLTGSGAAAAPAPAATPAPAVSPAAAAAVAPSSGAAAPAVSRPAGPSLGAMFAQISSIDQSSGKTAGLRHVDKKAVAEEKAKALPVPSPSKSAAGAAAAPAARRGEAGAVFPSGAARCVKDELRWLVDYQVDNKAAPLHVTQATIREEVYIFGCQRAVVYIDTKVKGVRIDTCRDLIVFVDSALSGVEIVNCKKVKIQVAKTLPSVAIDKTDGIVVGLSYASRSITQMVTSKSSEMNVTFPVSEAEDADWIEVPIPEQFVSKITADGKLLSGVSDLYTH